MSETDGMTAPTPQQMRDPRPFLIHTVTGSEFRSGHLFEGDDYQFLPRDGYAQEPSVYGLAEDVNRG